ncbi:fibronectin type III domain-containing protein 1 [Xenopus laevis]|uniref:Fibronectin type III domain-containing protein 1 n=2 Tax=Xenopus laevis TaxID=8355 RepID=A0A1L8G7K9_XENLA|nr:fibronectin type III domain-containing protein 1 [Xenopus laevis]OCT79887.1 hypothetical protein XELAEV_18026699mg [Xenopus laevis]
MSGLLVSGMSERKTRRASASLSFLVIILLSLLASSAAATERKAPKRIFRVRPRPAGERLSALQALGLRTTRRLRGYSSSPGESARKINYAPLKPNIQKQDNKQRASESVHVVSLPSMNSQRKSQPVFRAAVTKLKIPEETHFVEPKDVSVRVISSQSVLVSWIDPDYEKSAKVGSNRQYSVRYREKGESATWDYKQVNTRRALVDKLNPDAMYEFSVRISLEGTEGQWSSSVFQRTPESAPTSAPENFDVEPIKGKGTAVMAKWDDLDDANGRIKEYIISYTPALKPFGGKSLSYSGRTSSTIIEGLHPGERYIFKIRAANRRGQGPQSKAVTVIMPIASTASKTLYPPSQRKHVEKLEEKQEKDSLSTSEETLNLKSNFKTDTDSDSNAKTSHTIVNKNPLESSKKTVDEESSPQSTEITEDTNLTTPKPKFAPIPPRRRVVIKRPVNSGINNGRRPIRKNPTQVEQKKPENKLVSPTLSVDEDNETNEPELDESDKYSLSERNPLSKVIENIPNESKEEEDHPLPDFNDSKNVVTNISPLDSSSKKIESSSHGNIDDGEPGLDISKYMPEPPSASAPKKESTYTNHRKPLSRFPISQGNSRSSSNSVRIPIRNQPNPSSKLPSVPKVEKETSETEEKPKVISSQKTVPHLKPQRQPSVNKGKEPGPHITHHSRNPDVDINGEATDIEEINKYSDFREHGSSKFPVQKSSKIHTSSKLSSSSDTKPISSDKDSDHANTEETGKEKEVSQHKKLKTAVSNTAKHISINTPIPTTISTTMISTTTTYSTVKPQTTSKSYKPNIRDFNKYTAEKTQTDSVPSFSGKSALSILEYYRRRSSKVKSNVGTRVTYRNNIKVQDSTSTIVPTTTMSTTETVATTLTSKYLEEDTKEEKGKYNLVPSRPTVNIKTDHQSLNELELNLRVSSTPQTLSKVGEKSSSPALISTKQTNNLPSKTNIVQPKYKKIIAPKIPVRDSKKISTSSIPSQKFPKENLLPHDRKSLTSNKKSNISSDTSSLEKTEKIPDNSMSTSDSISPSSSSIPSRTGSALPFPDRKSNNLESKNKEGIYQGKDEAIMPSVESYSYLPSNRNIDIRKTSLGRPYKNLTNPHSLSKQYEIPEVETNKDTKNKPKSVASSPLSKTLPGTKQRIGYKVPIRVEGVRKINKPNISPSIERDETTHISPSLAKGKNDDDFHKASIKTQPTAKEESPTSSLSSHSPSLPSSGILTSRNINRNDYEKNNFRDSSFSQVQSTKLEDEESLSAPSTLKDIHQKSSGASSNSKYSIVQRKTSSTTTVMPTTSHSHISTRTSPYRLIPSFPRRPSFGRPLLSTTTPPRTTTLGRTVSPTSSLRQRIINSRLRSPLRRQFGRPLYRQGNNGRPNLSPRVDSNGNVPSATNGQKIIHGPQGTKWVVDLNRGLVLNPEGRFLQDSQGKPLRIKMGGDGRTIVDMNGAPVVSPDGLPLFGNGRYSKPVANAQDKPVLSLGGRPLKGLEVPRTTRIPTTIPTTTPTTTIATTTTTTTTTTPPTTTPEPTTIEQTTEEVSMPTCPPGTYSQYDEEGNLIMGPDDKPDCYTEDSFSGQDLIVTTEASEIITYPDLDEDNYLFETTEPPIKLTTKSPTPPEVLEIESISSNLVSEYDVAGKKRFTAPYVTYISKDPSAPCSLTEALEHFQVENLEDIIPKDISDPVLPPQKISYNITVVAVEGCHSFVILDWAKPKKGDFITGYLVYSASYEDFLRNKWSTRTAGATNFPVENLKPNTRYYFKIQAENPYGVGPVSPHVSFVTESDNPLLIVRPPGGEPIWIPFTFKHDSSFSGCSGKQYVKRTWYRKFVGVVLCNSLRYKIYLSENLRDTFYSVGDSWGHGEDHCQFVDSYMEGRTGPLTYAETMPTVNGYYRQYVQEPVSFGQIGFGTPHNYVGWYECGVPIPGKW